LRSQPILATDYTDKHRFKSKRLSWKGQKLSFFNLFFYPCPSVQSVAKTSFQYNNRGK
jgi:hypothetical protein